MLHHSPNLMAGQGLAVFAAGVRWLFGLFYSCLSYLAFTFSSLEDKSVLIEVPYKFYVLGQLGLSKQCRPRSDCF